MLVAIATSLMLAMTSCASSRTVYKVIEIDFPDFPIIDSAIYDEENNIVKIDFDEFERLAKFKVDYFYCMQDYNEIKEIYEKAE